MRWHIIRTLFVKEVHRQLANRGSLALAALLVVASLLLTLFNKNGGQAGAHGRRRILLSRLLARR